MVNLVVVAHPDDEILGFGGSGSFYVGRGEKVVPVILCGEVDARTHRPTDKDLYEDIVAANSLVGFESPDFGAFPNIRMNTVAHLELVQFVEKQIVKYRPDRIFTHHPLDINDDHKQVSNACMAAARLFQRRDDIPALKGLYFMEVLSATDWSFPTGASGFQPQLFVDITSTIDNKINALASYRNVMRDAPHPRSESVVRGHASYRGGQSGFMFAESFQVAFQSGL